jgi:hypothetical protein
LIAARYLCLYLEKEIEKMFLFCYIHSKGCNLDLCFLVALQKRSTYHCVSSLFLLL